MRPLFAVSLELVALAAILWASLLVPSGIVFAIYLIVTQLATTYLIHCPAHYVSGELVGIRFRGVRLGRTTLVKALPAKYAALAKLVPIVTISTEKASLHRVSKTKAAAMYASGTVASASSAFVIAAAATPSEPAVVASLAWLVALAYLLFDVVFSPKSGDLMRARAILRT